MKEFVSFRHPIIWTGLKNLTQTFLLIGIKDNSVYNAWIKFKVLNQHGDNGIYSFMQWLQFRSTRK